MVIIKAMMLLSITIFKSVLQEQIGIIRINLIKGQHIQTKIL